MKEEHNKKENRINQGSKRGRQIEAKFLQENSITMQQRRNVCANERKQGNGHTKKIKQTKQQLNSGKDSGKT